MTNKRQRLLELALESLQKKKSGLELEIDSVLREMRGPERAEKKRGPAPVARKRPKLSKAERMRRSARMKAFWENRRKEKRAGA